MSPSVGGKVKILSSDGQHSKRFVGQSGVAVSNIGHPDKMFWVVRFASVLPRPNPEGLYAEHELEWIG